VEPALSSSPPGPICNPLLPTLSGICRGGITYLYASGRLEETYLSYLGRRWGGKKEEAGPILSDTYLW